jgi:hypothetical protein
MPMRMALSSQATHGRQAIVPENASGHSIRKQSNMDFGLGGFLNLLDHNLIGEAEEVEIYSKEYVRMMTGKLWVCVIFMVFYVFMMARGLNNSSYYEFANAVRGQISEVEFREEHSPVLPKTFDDVSTVQELYHWMEGPLVHTVASSDTFDGARPTESETQQGRALPTKGSVLGYSKILGGVRIAQIRARKRDCDQDVPPALQGVGSKWDCYGKYYTGFEFGNRQFDLGEESTETYGSLSWPDTSNRYNFTYDGMQVNATEAHYLKDGFVKEERDRLFSSFTTPVYWNTYPTPSHAVIFDPAMGVDELIDLIKQLAEGRYIDLETRAIFVDFSIYNPMLDRLCWCRLAAEIQQTGGVVTSTELEVARLWEGHSWWDKVYIGIGIIVGLFYLQYMREEILEFRQDRAAYFSDFFNLVQILNIILFW